MKYFKPQLKQGEAEWEAANSVAAESAEVLVSWLLLKEWVYSL